MAENAERRRRRNDPAYLAEKREERRLRCARLGAMKTGVFFLCWGAVNRFELCMHKTF